MTLRCAIYARYSSDQQSPSSLQDQIRKCREYAQQHGWIMLDQYIYTDAELSGAGADRPALQRLLTVVQERPRKFDVLLIDDTSRLSRRQADQSNIAEQLRFSGFRFIAVSQGIDSAHEQSDVLMTVHGLVDSLYLKELGKKTHRGLEGQVLRGNHAGGRCFGYQNEMVEGGSRRVVDPVQAAVVVRILEMYASGLSYRNVAKTLNAEHVPTVRPRAGRRYASWCPTMIRALLRNELYIGRVVWNKAQFIKRPGTNKRVARERPRTDWKIVESPELRIVSDDLWRRVQDRLDRMKSVYGPAGTGINKASSSPNLLTGLLKCGTCGANLIVTGGWRKHGHPYYGCSQNFHRGACENGVRVRQEIVERNLFARLQEEVLTPDVIDYAVKEFIRQSRARRTQPSNHAASVQERQRQMQAELKHFAAAIAEGGHSKFLLDEITKRERLLEELAQTMQQSVVEHHPGDVRKLVRDGFSDLFGLLKTNVARARAELAKYTNEIRLVPQQNGEAWVYYAEGVWDLLGNCRFAMVAGDRNDRKLTGLPYRVLVSDVAA